MMETGGFFLLFFWSDDLLRSEGFFGDLGCIILHLHFQNGDGCGRGYLSHRYLGTHGKAWKAGMATAGRHGVWGGYWDITFYLSSSCCCWMYVCLILLR